MSLDPWVPGSAWLRTTEQNLSLAERGLPTHAVSAYWPFNAADLPQSQPGLLLSIEIAICQRNVLVHASMGSSNWTINSTCLYACMHRSNTDKSQAASFLPKPDRRNLFCLVSHGKQHYQRSSLIYSRAFMCLAYICE